MATPTTTSSLRRFFQQGDLWLILGLFGTVLLLILPIPPLALDLFLAISIGLSLLILLVILYIEEAADFTGFPTLLLCITLFRLSLNVASTRLILLDGYAGHIIEAFGNFVVRGNYVVGLVIFLILVLPIYRRGARQAWGQRMAPPRPTDRRWLLALAAAGLIGVLLGRWIGRHNRHTQVGQSR